MAEFARDETTGDYQVTDGKPVIDTSLAPPCRTRLRAHLGGWMHDKKLGSDYFRYTKRRSVDFSDGLAESIALKALQPLVDDGRADNLEAETQFTQRGGVAVKVGLLDRQKQQTIEVTTPVGT